MERLTNRDSRDGIIIQEVIDRLAAYEDTGLEPSEINHILDAYGRGLTLRTDVGGRLEIIKDIPTDRLKELAQAEKDGHLVVLPSNDPLTLEELQEMNGEPVWVCGIRRNRYMPSEWATVYLKWQGCKTASGGIVFFDRYNDTWIAYRRKPSE